AVLLVVADDDDHALVAQAGQRGGDGGPPQARVLGDPGAGQGPAGTEGVDDVLLACMGGRLLRPRRGHGATLEPGNSSGRRVQNSLRNVCHLTFGWGAGRPAPTLLRHRRAGGPRPAYVRRYTRSAVPVSTCSSASSPSSPMTSSATSSSTANPPSARKGSGAMGQSEPTMSRSGP